MNLRSQAVLAVAWSALQNWGSTGINFLVFLLLARILEPKVFGLVALANVFFAFVQVFLNQGFSDAIVQRQELKSEHLDTAFWSNVTIGIFLMLLGMALAGTVADLFHEPQLIPIIRWLSVGFLLGALSSVQQALLSRQFAFKTLAIRSLLAIFAGGSVGLVLAIKGFGVWSLVGQQLVNGLVGMVILWRSSAWSPGFKVSFSHFQELFSFGINVVGVNILNFINRRSDDFLIGYFLGTVALGYYTVAYRVLLVMTQLLTSTMMSVALPTFSRLQQEPERLRNAFYTATQVTSLIAFPSFVGVCAIAPELVELIFGENWAASVPVMQILSLIGILHSVFYFNDPVITAMGKPFWRVVLTAINAIANFTVFVLVVRWGIIAVATAYVLRGYLLAAPPVWAVKKLININIKTYILQLLPPMLCSLIMATVLLITKYFLGSLSINLYVLTALYIVLGATVYSLSIWLFAPAIIQKVFELANPLIPLMSNRKA